MAKVYTPKYHRELVNFLRNVGGHWNAEGKFWAIPDEAVNEVEAKIRELSIDGVRIEVPPKPAEKPKEGTIRMTLSRDGRFVLINVSLLAFSEDVKQLLEGRRRSVRFRVLPARGSKSRG